MRFTPSRALRCQVLLLAATLAVGACLPAHAQSLDPATAGRFVRLALDCVHREYPNKIAHVLASERDVGAPRQLTPAFYGCYDWHSAVHGHWLLVRLVRFAGHGEFEPAARVALARSLTARNIAGELHYLNGHGRIAFERPYSLAWLLQLAAELREWDDADAARWRAALEPLERQSARRMADWLPKLTHPIRGGEHSQTAFALGLVLDWARVAGDRGLRRRVRTRTEDYYGQDRDCPLAYEPSGQDFLSPCLAEADLLRRVRSPHDFAAWLDRFLPGIPRRGDPGGGQWLEPAVVSDPRDGKLAHLDGLNLSRAWMLDGIAAGPPAGAARGGPPPPGGRTGRGHRGTLRRRPLARQLRHLSGDEAGPELTACDAPRGPAPHGKANASTLLVDTTAMYCFPLT